MSTRNFFYVSSTEIRSVEDSLAYGHRLANRFATRKEAERVARELLHLSTYRVWYRDAKGSNRRVVEVSA